METSLLLSLSVASDRSAILRIYDPAIAQSLIQQKTADWLRFFATSARNGGALGAL
jgi:hypothetical protein